MKGLRAVLLTLGLALAAFFSYGGCGGTGGGGTPTTFVLVRVELPGQDPLNLEVGMNVQFVLAGYDVNFTRFVLSTNTWNLTNVQGAPGTLNSNGSFNATGVGSGTVNATWPGHTVTGLNFQVRPLQAKVTGSVRSESSGNGVSGVIVVFFNDANTEVGRATTNASGTFLGSVPTTATKVNLDRALMPPGWYAEWLYRAVRYSSSTMVPNCHAVMVLNQPLANGATSTMPDPIFISSTLDPPPPPPNGCQ